MITITENMPKKIAIFQSIHFALFYHLTDLRNQLKLIKIKLNLIIVKRPIKLHKFAMLQKKNRYFCNIAKKN